MWTDGWEEMNGPARDGDRLSMPQTRLSILCYQAGQARPAGLATAASGPSTAALLSRIATVARLRTQGNKRVSGLSGYAHAANELLLHRLRFEEDQRVYLRCFAGQGGLPFEARVLERRS